MKRWYFAWVCSLFLALGVFSSAYAERLMSVERLDTGPAFFNVTIQDSGLLAGTFPGWCADWAVLIQDGKLYDTTFFSSYSSNLPADILDRPENLDEVNWLINQTFVGNPSPSGYGLYTSGDVQIAIWSLLNDYYETGTAGPYSQARVDELVNLALVQGSGFYPKCREFVGFLLLPKDRGAGSRVQTTIIKIPRWRFPKCAIPESGK